MNSSSSTKIFVGGLAADIDEGTDALELIYCFFIPCFFFFKKEMLDFLLIIHRIERNQSKGVCF